MQINWLVRIKNKMFWIALIPAVFILIQAILQVIGIDFDYTEISMRLTGVVEALFVVLAILGIVVDPTTDGWSDSFRALGYSNPAPNAKEMEHVDKARTEITD